MIWEFYPYLLKRKLVLYYLESKRQLNCLMDLLCLEVTGAEDDLVRFGLSMSRLVVSGLTAVDVCMQIYIMCCNNDIIEIKPQVNHIVTDCYVRKRYCMGSYVPV